LTLQRRAEDFAQNAALSRAVRIAIISARLPIPEFLGSLIPADRK